MQSRNQAHAHLTTKEQKQTITKKADTASPSDLSELSVEEISKLRLFLKTIQNGSGSMA